MTERAKSITQYVALLRGINVGGNNVIKMTDLRASFEEQGFENVATYIQSGNVIFTAPNAKHRELPSRIEALLAQTFKCNGCVVVRSQKQMHEIVTSAPKGFGTQPDKYRYDAIFLKEPLKSSTAVESVKVKAGVDEAHAGPNVVYFSRLISKATQSQMGKIVALPIYKSMTIRNWNTTTKLLQMMDARTT